MAGRKRHDPYGYDREDQYDYFYDPQTDDYGGSSDQEYYDDGYYDDGYYDEYDGNYDAYPDEYDDGDGYYDDYAEEVYDREPVNRQPSMAARASGRANTEIYGRPRGAARPPSYPVYAREDYEPSYSPPRQRRRKKRHPLGKLLLFLLILAGIIAGLWLLLFRSPAKDGDPFRTRKDGICNILICATDEEQLRTDTMMIFTLDEIRGCVTLTSLPRDTIVANGEAVPKLNGVYGLGGGGEMGAEAMMDAVEELLGFRPDGYAVIDYQIFKDAVDAMGGVYFDVPMDMIVDNANDPNDVMEIPAGQQLLDGAMALGVCRYRYGYLMADIQRQYVQQSFLKAMLQQLFSLDKLTLLPDVYAAAMDNVITDLSGANIRYLALKTVLGGLDQIQQNTLPGEGVTYNGASCYGLFGQSVVDMVNETMNPYEEPITLEDVYILTVYQGALVESTWRGTAFDASQYQYD